MKRIFPLLLVIPAAALIYFGIYLRDTAPGAPSGLLQFAGYALMAVALFLSARRRQG